MYATAAGSLLRLTRYSSNHLIIVGIHLYKRVSKPAMAANTIYRVSPPRNSIRRGSTIAGKASRLRELLRDRD
nr:hypothetical protein [Tanacetum cinerariifolium]